MSQYVLSGRSGLRVSPLSLGAATFGEQWGEGFAMSKDEVDALIARYLEAGGNVIDTADGYQNGESETWIGDWLRRSGKRNEVVIATKFGFRSGDGPFGGGNARATIQRQVEASLKRLGIDTIDLYYLHVWDTLTPPDEVARTFDLLVQQGKIRHVGLSNVPAWYLGRFQTLAQMHGWEPVSAVQMNYSLIARNIELEYTDAAQALGFGIHAWSPLANGLLTGKYEIAEDGTITKGGGRVTDSWVTDRTVNLADPRVRNTVKAVVEVASELGRTPAQVALRWLIERPGVASVILGARSVRQLEDNLGALEFSLPAELHAKLEEASRPAPTYPYSYFGETIQRGGVHSDHDIRAESRTYRGPGARW